VRLKQVTVAVTDEPWIVNEWRNGSPRLQIKGFFFTRNTYSRTRMYVLRSWGCEAAGDRGCSIQEDSALRSMHNSGET
jgi:hypothetical protein